MRNVKDNKCKEPNCNIIPCFGLKGEKATHCHEHKTEEMVNVKDRVCEWPECTTRPSFGYPGERQCMCRQHRQENMVDVVHKQCHLCSTLAMIPKYRGYCVRCFIYTFPNEPVTRNYKIKEKHLADFITATYPELNITFDKPIHGACSKRRPDCLIELYTHTIIVECDENQHAEYDTICEEARINELYTDLADRSIVFIRFNPDGYTEKAKKHMSSFKYHQTQGIPIIRNPKEWNARLEKVKQTIDHYVNKPPEQAITIVPLFFDTN
jgi:hypothetical protein